MSCKPMCPFRILSQDDQLAIYGRMCQTELKTISKICAVAEQFIKKNFKNTLKLQPEDKIRITADSRGVFVHISGPGYTGEGIAINVDSYSDVAPNSIDQLTIAIRDNSKLDEVSRIMKSVKPVCNSASFYGGIPSSLLLEWLEHMKCPEGVYIDCAREDGSEMIENLRQIENCANAQLRIKSVSDYDDLLDEARVFGKVEVETTEQRIEQFIHGLRYGKDLGNLEEITLSTEKIARNHRLISQATLLYARDRKCSSCFSKLPLQHNMCLFIEEAVLDGRTFAFCKLMKNNYKEILDLLLEKLGMSLEDIKIYSSLDYAVREQLMRTGRIENIFFNSLY